MTHLLGSKLIFHCGQVKWLDLIEISPTTLDNLRRKAELYCLEYNSNYFESGPTNFKIAHLQLKDSCSIFLQCKDWEILLKCNSSFRVLLSDPFEQIKYYFSNSFKIKCLPRFNSKLCQLKPTMVTVYEMREVCLKTLCGSNSCNENLLSFEFLFLFSLVQNWSEIS